MTNSIRYNITKNIFLYKKGSSILKNILNNTYVIKDFSTKNLKCLGFHYNKEFGNADRSCYSIRFPAVKYNSHASIEGEITVDTTDGSIFIDVYDLKGNYYIPFYNHEYGNFDDILQIINKSIERQLRKCKIKKV